MSVSYHEEHVVPPRTQDGFILESKRERDKFGPHVFSDYVVIIHI